MFFIKSSWNNEHHYFLKLSKDMLKPIALVYTVSMSMKLGRTKFDTETFIPAGVVLV